MNTVQKINSGKVRVGYFGPSTADNYIGVADMHSVFSQYPSSGYAQYDMKPGSIAQLCCVGGFDMVACGGRSGETIQESYNRFSLAYSSGRKSAYDIAQLNCDVVIYKSCAINDIQGYSSINQTTIYQKAQIEIDIAKYFISRGIQVIFEGVYGYSASVSSELLAVRRQCVLQYNEIYKAFSNRMFSYCDPSGITLDTNGAFLTGVSEDGIHLNRVGGLRLTQKERTLINRLCGSYPSSEVSIYDGTRGFAGADGSTFAFESSNCALTVSENLSTHKKVNITSPSNGTALADWIFTGASLPVEAGKSYTAETVIELTDSVGNVINYDESISVQYRATARNSSNCDAFIDNVYLYEGGLHTNTFCIPASGTLSLLQIFVKFTFDTAGIYNLRVTPLVIKQN